MAENKKATTIDEQIKLLQTRGMVIDDIEKAKENLLDIGYFRLGFYWFPFEATYPRKSNRTHQFRQDANFDWAIKLYYFDFDLRNLLLRYISRIEVNFRTTVVYLASNEYKDNPYWYVDNSVIKKETLQSDEYQRALKEMCSDPFIKHDSKTHGNRPYPPAWKAFEFLSFGTIVKVYEGLKNPHLRCDISNHFGMSHPTQFTNYINTVRRLRNSCAHEKVLFDMNLTQSIGDGPLGNLGNRRTMLSGAYQVFKYLLGCISMNRVKEMQAELINAFDRVSYPVVKNVIFNNSGFRMNEI